MMQFGNIKILAFLLFTTLLMAAAPLSEDGDGDGVVDFRDDCVATPHGYYVDAHGCANLLVLHPNFSKGSFVISDALESEIKTLVEFMKNRPYHVMKIVGHSSKTAVSGDAYNMRLSKQRAEALKKELVRRGIAADRITTVGKGFHEPIYTNETKEGRRKNRRLEIEFSEE